MIPDPDVGAAIADLLGRPLEEFTAARDGLVNELKQAGRRDDAAALGALRKPRVHLWAANQLARRRPVAVKRLLSAAVELSEAQREALAGSRWSRPRSRQPHSPPIDQPRSDLHVRGSERPYREGHPRFNVAVVLLLLLALLAFALVAAQRLAF